MGTFSIWHWLVVLLIVVLLFGTKKLRNLGSDLGTAVKSFKKAVSEGEQEPANTPPPTAAAVAAPATSARVEEHKGSGTVIEGEVRREKDQRV